MKPCVVTELSLFFIIIVIKYPISSLADRQTNKKEVKGGSQSQWDHPKLAFQGNAKCFCGITGDTWLQSGQKDGLKCLLAVPNLVLVWLIDSRTLVEIRIRALLLLLGHNTDIRLSIILILQKGAGYFP